jgi:hypothetical protein
LRSLIVGHYIVAALEAVVGFVPSLHLALGLWMLTSPDLAQQKSGPPVALFGGFFVLVALAVMLTAWSLAVGLFVAGRRLAQRRHWTFCLVMAGVVAAMCMPLGTILGVFTIIVLMRPAVREAFGAG